MRTELHHLLEQMAVERGDSPALTFGKTTASYSELWRDVAAFGGGLIRSGLAGGERVAVYLEKTLETVTAMFGASAAGGVFVPVNPILRPKQVGHILEDCQV